VHTFTSTYSIFLDALSTEDQLKKNYIPGAIDMRQKGRKNNGKPCDRDRARGLLVVSKGTEKILSYVRLVNV